MLKITILGCGSSLGTPVIGCTCKICKSNNILNKRTRPSILIQSNLSSILIDAGYDIRNQLLREEINKIDSVVLTHHHTDHIIGIDDLRSFSYTNKRPIKIFTNETTCNLVSRNFDYLVAARQIELEIIKDTQELTLGNINIKCFKHLHGNTEALSIKIKDTLYSCDISSFLESSKPELKNLKNWIIDCISYKDTPSHVGLETVLKYNKEFKPEKMYLTGLSHKLDYESISSTLPRNIAMLYDGYKLDIS